ncbi:MAG TPA: acyl transferase [Bacteroidia bacterium]|nr:acyl transferase [Bacteroidia bacterium]
MPTAEELSKRIFQNEFQFEETALDVFRYQFEGNEVYRQYVQLLGIQPESITTVADIPFLPIRFFKTHKIITGNQYPEITFTSSGTSGQTVSRHFVTDVSLYEKSFIKGFEKFYGSAEEWCILALLPSYLEREGSSLVYMCEHLIKKSKHPLSGFYLHNYDNLYSVLEQLESEKQKTLLLGVSYALLDLAEQFPLVLQHTIIMETGGMKGKRREMTKAALHNRLKNAFNVDVIHSECGMTEMLSQAYSLGNGIYSCPPWLRLIVRDSYDPFTLVDNEITGGINVIDLANVNSCSFIATQDMGKVFDEGTFEIIGRFDDAEIRGCNLMIE